MCEFIKSLNFTNWIDFIQMIIAFGSAIFLWLTFKSQGKSYKRNLKLAELEQRAKRAEYMPEFDVKIRECTLPSSEDGYGGSVLDYSKDRYSKIKLELKVLKNPIKIHDMQLKNSLGIEISGGMSHASINDKVVFLPNKVLELCFDINFFRFYGFNESDPSSGDWDIIINKQIAEKVKNLSLQQVILFEDMLGFKYEMEISLYGLSEVEISKVELLN